LAVATAITSISHAASSYPSHPVRVIVPFAPGGVVDVMARILTTRLSLDMGERFYIENLGGAGGNIGTQKARVAANDGYTLLITSSSFVVNPSLRKSPYDPVADFVPISIAAASPNVLVVNPAVPAKTVADLVADIKRSPDKFSFASAGVGTTPHLSGELFNLSTGLHLVHVPFPGAGPALQSTAGGHTPIAFSSLPSAVPLIKNGSLRALATTSAKRVDALPDVPTMAEQGFAGQEAETLVFILAPVGTPPEIVGQLSEELRKLLQNAQVEKQLDALGFRALATTPDQSAQRVREEIAKWSKVIRGAKLRVDD